MTRAADLGPGDVWGLPIESLRHCRTCGIDEESAEFCSHGNCFTHDCCGTCVVCREVMDTDDLCACPAPRCLDCGCVECKADEWPAPCCKCGEVTAFLELHDGLCSTCDPLVCQSCGTRGKIVHWRGRTTRWCCECYAAGMEDCHERIA